MPVWFVQRRGTCLLCDEFYRVVAFDAVAHKGGRAIVVFVSVACAPHLGVRAFFVPASSPVSRG